MFQLVPSLYKSLRWLSINLHCGIQWINFHRKRMKIPWYHLYNFDPIDVGQNPRTCILRSTCDKDSWLSPQICAALPPEHMALK